MQTRRGFLRTTVGAPLLWSLAPSIPGFLSRSAAAATARSTPTDRVLVVIQLSGGNDGLNTVVPFTDDAYARSRPTLRLAPGAVRKITSDLGFHPRMAGFERLFKDGQLAVVQGVGCDGLSRDHDVAMRVWQTATPAPAETGWLGRTADLVWHQHRPHAPGVFVGAIPAPFGLRSAETIVPTLQRPEAATTRWPNAPRSTPAPSAAPSALLDHVRASFDLARSHAPRLTAPDPGTSAADYPDCGLARDLRTVARLIRAHTGLRLFHVELGGGGIGGFDNHANQLGNHCALLQQLSDSLAAFAADLETDHLLRQVLILTFSEFGRTVTENGRRGTDHGAAGPMFLLGGNVRPGIHGPHPSLTHLDGDALKHGLDFRAVYTDVLEHWLGLPALPILGRRFDPPGLLAVS